MGDLLARPPTIERFRIARTAPAAGLHPSSVAVNAHRLNVRLREDEEPVLSTVIRPSKYNADVYQVCPLEATWTAVSLDTRSSVQFETHPLASICRPVWRGIELRIDEPAVPGGELLDAVR